jgi:3-phenylpropionate/trans-cinnamate dioxygenase ferredoxin component
MKSVEAGGQPVCLVHADDGNWYAVEDRYSHEATPLSEGWLEGREIECPLHNSIFDISTGKALSLPATESIRVFAVTADGDDLVVDLGDDPPRPANNL